MTSELLNLARTPAAKGVIALCSAMPALRPFFSAMRMTPANFGDRVVRVPLRPHRQSLRMTGAESVHLVYQLFWSGIDYYEPFTRLIVENLTASTDCFIDVGANVGLFSLVAAKLNPRLKVFAFEPNPHMFDFLSKHKLLNRLSNLIPNSMAVSDRDGEAQLFLSQSDMSASLASDFQEANSLNLSLPVKTVTLDSYVRQSGISGSMLLKLDAEGHEKAVLEGAEDTIARFKPDMIIEVLDDFDPFLLEQFHDLGYRFYKITHHGLIEAQTVTLTKMGDFVFYNYLFTTRPAAQLDRISELIRERARHINLYLTSKYVGTRVPTTTAESVAPLPAILEHEEA
jgi:FkbM family methyltransferase